jgi:hypothetical protein
MAHDVFISHSTEDKPAADAICAILEENGVRCWIAPRDIMPGADWGESIVKAIRSSRVVLLVFSTNANKSKQIKREVEIAADGGVTIVPLRIENALPTELQIFPWKHPLAGCINATLGKASPGGCRKGESDP